MAGEVGVPAAPGQATCKGRGGVRRGVEGKVRSAGADVNNSTAFSPTAESDTRDHDKIAVKKKNFCSSKNVEAVGAEVYRVCCSPQDRAQPCARGDVVTKGHNLIATNSKHH